MAHKKPPGSPWSPPKQFDEYRILWQLGRGGMGEVYLGHDTLLDRPVAIKFISAIDPDVGMREQFLNEARAAARLQHPNVVTVFRVGEIDGHPYIISEFVRGQNVDRVKLPMPWTRALELGIGLARGLAAAHRRGVLHRDIKPGNVILANDGQVKILDFGLAKFIEGNVLRDVVGEQPEALRLHVTAPTLDVKSADSAEDVPLSDGVRDRGALDDTADPVEESASPKMSRVQISFAAIARAGLGGGRQKPGGPAASPATPTNQDALEEADTGERPVVPAGFDVPPPSAHDDHLSPNQTSSGIKGTPLYMAPEVLNGEPASRRSDIYSMGALLYELCTGSPPHYDPLMTLADLRRIANNQSAVTMAKVVANIDPRFASAIERCLHRDPQARFSSGEELRDALEQIADTSKKEEIPAGNPYRGLLPFEAEHRSLFFGRKSEIGTLIDRLRTEAFIVVAADSGVGKSSVCRAGVLPLIAEGALGGNRAWKEVLMIPGRRPLQSLVIALSRELGIDEEQFTKALHADPANLPRELHKRLGDKRGLVLFIDQMEELMTIGDREETLVVGEALASLVNRAPHVRLLATVRSDFLARLASVPGIGDEINRALYILRPLNAEKIREVITGPAHKKGVSFENDEMLKLLVESTAQADGGLPLLQFALAELWEVKTGDVITARALESIGGVEGALARHADHVLSRLQSEQRLVARRILMNLVTVEGTRARRIEDELVREGAPAKTALEALVRGRLLVARDTPEGAAYEVAHEALIKGWGTLKRWLEENAESRAVKQRLEVATAEWLRLGRNRDALWGGRQIAETALLEAVDIGPKERDFLVASRNAAERTKRLRRALFAAIPLFAVGMYGATRVLAARDLERRIQTSLTQGRKLFDDALRQEQTLLRVRSDAYKKFDEQKRDDAEELWSQALKLARETDRAFTRAGQVLEAALSLDSNRADVRTAMTDVLFARARAAERDSDPARVEDLIQRMSLYDKEGSRLREWQAPAHFSLTTNPPGARVFAQKYSEDEKQYLRLSEKKELTRTPVSDVELAPGSYLFTIELDGYDAAKYPVLLGRSESFRANVDLLRKAQIPSGFVYVPKGRFRFGPISDEPLRKRFFNTAPSHDVWTENYFISVHETTFAEYIDYLKEQPKDKVEELLPKVGGGGSAGMMSLTLAPNGHWVLKLRPTTHLQEASDSESMVFAGRKVASPANWLRFPVMGLNAVLATRYADWLAKTGRVPGARLCTEQEWERAARGADNRKYPTGNELYPEDANFDMTFGRRPDAIGPTEVGFWQTGASPFGVFDMAGNVNEFVSGTLAADEVMVRGGTFGYELTTCRSENRSVLDKEYREADMGVRICTSLPRR